MPFEDVYLVNDQLNLVAPEEIDDLETRLGFPLPFGYREYLTTLGRGCLCWWLELLDPEEVKSKSEKRSQSEEYWQSFVVDSVDCESWNDDCYWHDGCLLTAEEMTTTVLFAENLEADCFVYCPSRGRGIFELPRHDSVMRYLPEGFLTPFECPGGARRAFQFPFFKPDNDRQMCTVIVPKDASRLEEVWNLTVAKWESSMRFATKDVAHGPLVFIKSIQGYVAIHDEGRSIELSYDIDHKVEVQRELKKAKRLVRCWQGDVPEF